MGVSVSAWMTDTIMAWFDHTALLPVVLGPHLQVQLTVPSWHGTDLLLCVRAAGAGCACAYCGTHWQLHMRMGRAAGICIRVL